MIIQHYSRESLSGVMRIKEKLVTWQDSELILRETPVEKLLNKEDLRKWKKRMKEVDSEEEIAREIEVDMITKGFVLISEVRE